MIAPTQGSSTSYNAGLSATAYAQPDYQRGAAYLTPSGGQLGGFKVALGEVAAQSDADALLRYGIGPSAERASSEAGWVAKDSAVHYLTEGEYGAAASSAWGSVRRGWENPDCRMLALAALVAAWLFFGRR